MYLGGILSVVLAVFWVDETNYMISIILGSILMVPGGIDGLTQMSGERESTNKLRAITGATLGVGVVLLSFGILYAIL